jgi:hypothetical protein
LDEGLACLAYPPLSVGVTPVLHGPDTGAFQVQTIDTATNSNVDGSASVLIP